MTAAPSSSSSPARDEIIGEHDMPRTATGKIQHRKLRERFQTRPDMP